MRCGDCGVSAQVTRSGKDPVTGRYIFIGPGGERWHQNRCSDCKPTETHLTKVRSCRKCRDALPPSRYFDCLRCVPELPTISDDLIYSGGEDLFDALEIE